jgi:glyoxylase-like metal-dependent hydrolase (beta-lactamase superfamily II)
MIEQKRSDAGLWPETEALMEAVAWPDTSPRPAVVLAGTLLAAGRIETGYRYFHERALAAPRNPVFQALEGTFQARLAATLPLDEAGPTLVEALGKLDRAVTQAPGATTYFRGLVLAEVPPALGRAEAAVADLEQVLEAADTLSPGMLRGLYRALAKAYRTLGREEDSRRMLKRSGYTSLDGGPQFPADSSVTLRDGFRFRTPRLLEVGPGIHVAQSFDFGDFAFVETAEGIVAIDAGTVDANVEAALAQLRAKTAKPITHVILTHAHWDHIGGLGALRGPSTEIIAQARFPEELKIVEATPIPRGEWFGERAEGGYDVAPDRLIAEPETLTVGGVELVLYPVRGGETSDGLLIHLPQHELLFVGDVLMPYLGAPFLPEGSAEGLFETIDLIQRLRPRRLVHGHTGLTENFTVEILPTLGAALRELHDDVLAAIREGEPLHRILSHNVLPAVLRERPDAVMPYLITRDNLVQRVHRQRTGYWQPDGEGVITTAPADWARALDLLAGGREQAFADAARSLLAGGEQALALRVLDLGLLRHPGDEDLTGLRGRALDGLRGRYQLLDPFRFIWFSQQQGAEVPPPA